MAGKTPKLTLDAFIDRFRKTVRCVARAEVFGSGHAVGRIGSITLVPHGGQAGNIVPLRTRDGHRDLLFAVYHQYTVVPLSDDPRRGSYEVNTTYYSYEVLDLDEQEILIYQWHPEGVSDVTFPHLHIQRVSPIPLARTDPVRSVAIGEMHLPTNRMLLEDVVELLIREFAIEPQREDWERILEGNRAAIRREAV